LSSRAYQYLERGGFFPRAEILTLQVFDQREDVRLVVSLVITRAAIWVHPSRALWLPQAVDDQRSARPNPHQAALPKHGKESRRQQFLACQIAPAVLS
jgi:hypothetical protein